MTDFENIKSENKPVQNNANNKDNPYSGDYPESVVLESRRRRDLLPNQAWAAKLTTVASPGWLRVKHWSYFLSPLMKISFVCCPLPFLKISITMFFSLCCNLGIHLRLQCGQPLYMQCVA